MLISTQITWWVVFMLLSAFFSGMEVAFVTSDKLRYAVTKKSTGLFNYMLNTIYGHPRQFLTTLTIGNLIALVLFVYFTVILADHLVLNHWTDSILVTFLFIILFASFLILITGEFLPRALFKRNANIWVKILLLPAFIFYVLFYPVAKVFISLSRSILRLFGLNTLRSNEKSLGRNDLDTYVKQGINMADEMDVDSEVKIFKNALDFSSMKLRDCMIPRADIVAISEDTDLDTLKDKFIETGLSRILVYNDTIDNIVGYIHMWEIFNSTEDWTKKVAPLSFVPESMQANQMMSDLMQQRRSIAVVVDEFGGTSGIITMEDLVEEIFGEIEDEYDVKSKFVKKENDNEYILSGRVEIDQLNENYDFDIPESDEYSTIAGYLLHHTQRFPKTYETVIIGKYTFKVLKVTARKIEVVKLIKDAASEE